jgi:hypothetical protein
MNLSVTAEVAGSSPVVPAINPIDTGFLASDICFHVASEGAESSLLQADLEGQVLSHSFFLPHSLLVHLQSDSGVGVSQQLLGRLEVNALLPKHDGEPMTEGVKADPLSDSNAGRI